MFETATFDSMGTIHTRSRNWMLATFSFNASILVLLIAIPLLHPSMLPQVLPQMMCCILIPPVQEAPPVVRQQAPAAASPWRVPPETAGSAESSRRSVRAPHRARRRIHHGPPMEIPCSTGPTPAIHRPSRCSSPPRHSCRAVSCRRGRRPVAAAASPASGPARWSAS